MEPAWLSNRTSVSFKTSEANTYMFLARVRSTWTILDQESINLIKEQKNAVDILLLKDGYGTLKATGVQNTVFISVYHGDIHIARYKKLIDGKEKKCRRITLDREKWKGLFSLDVPMEVNLFKWKYTCPEDICSICSRWFVSETDCVAGAVDSCPNNFCVCGSLFPSDSSMCIEKQAMTMPTSQRLHQMCYEYLLKQEIKKLSIEHCRGCFYEACGQRQHMENGCQGEMIDLIDFYYDEAINIVTVNKVKEIVKNLFQYANHRYPYDDLMCLYITNEFQHMQLSLRRDAAGLTAPIDWASGEIRKTTTSLVYEQSKTLRTRSAELIIAVNTPKASGLSPDLFLK